jgi:hypothetical protein
MRIRAVSKAFGALLSALVAHAALGQTAGDYGSWVTGAWNTAATWRIYDGVSWATSPAAGAAPGAGNNVYIRSGTTVTAAFGGTYACNNLYIEPTARLYNNNTGATNLSYVHVYGTTIQCDGNLGNGATLDGISLGINAANTTLSGTGTVNLARIRKEFVTHPISGASLATTNFTIAMNVNLRFSAGSTTMMYNGTAAASNFHVTINAGATVTLVGASGSGNICIDGLAGGATGSDTPQAGGSLTVNGTLIIPGTLFATTNNTNTAYECRITIGSTGYVRTTQVNAANSGAAWHRFFVNAGGTLEIIGTPTAWPAYGVTNNQFDFNATSLTIYSGAGPQDVRNVFGGYGHLRITGTGTKSLQGTTTAKGDLTITNASGTPILDVTTNNYQVTVQGNWTNYNQSAFIEQTGLVLFSGTSTQTINTTGGEQFFNWNIEKPAANPLVVMASNVTVANQLRIGTAAAAVSGIIDLNARLLTLSNPATTAIFATSGFGPTRHLRSERTDNLSRVRWDIGTTTGAHLVPFGVPTVPATYIPFTFNLTSGNAGTVTMATYGTPPDNLPWPTTPTLVTSLGSYLGLLSPDNRDATVDRFWQVDVTGTPTAELTFTYMPSELPVAPYNNPSSLLAQRWSSAGQLWEPQITGSAAAYWAVANVVNSFGPFTLSNIISPLPIELLRFTAQAEGDRVRLDWATASERNNDFFSVLRSHDGVRYDELFQVDGAGTSNGVRDYLGYDERPLSGLSYYKLRQTDTDGTWKESDAVAVRFPGPGTGPVLFPNPASDQVTLAGLDAGAAEITVLDAAGRTVARFRKEEDELVTMPVGHLPAGLYTVNVNAHHGRQTLRFARH